MAVPFDFHCLARDHFRLLLVQTAIRYGGQFPLSSSTLPWTGKATAVRCLMITSRILCYILCLWHSLFVLSFFPFLFKNLSPIHNIKGATISAPLSISSTTLILAVTPYLNLCWRQSKVANFKPWRILSHVPNTSAYSSSTCSLFSPSYHDLSLRCYSHYFPDWLEGFVCNSMFHEDDP